MTKYQQPLILGDHVSGQFQNLADFLATLAI